MNDWDNKHSLAWAPSWRVDWNMNGKRNVYERYKHSPAEWQIHAGMRPGIRAGVYDESGRTRLLYWRMQKFMPMNWKPGNWEDFFNAGWYWSITDVENWAKDKNVEFGWGSN